MLGFLEARLAGPIASAVAALLALALAFTWVSGNATERSLNSRIAALESSIDDPKAGWRARLGQCQTNVADATHALDAQTAQVRAWKSAADTAASRAAANAEAAKAAREAASKDASAILNLKPGADRCASALDLIRSH